MLCCYSQYSILLLPPYGIVRRAPYTMRQAANIANSLKAFASRVAYDDAPGEVIDPETGEVVQPLN